MKKVMGLVSAALALSGCAHHLNQQECMLTNWQQEGRQDASQGKMPRDLMPAAQDCMKFNIPVSFDQYRVGYKMGARQYCNPSVSEGVLDGTQGKELSVAQARISVCQAAGLTLNLNAYQVGRNQGLKQFCTAEKGSQIATEGRNLPPVCDPRKYPQFAAAWNVGRDQFCGIPQNGFALARDSKPYPDMCDPGRYALFKSEYDRGTVLVQRINDIKNQINARNDKIGSKPFRYDLRQNPDGTYYLGNNKSSDALSMVNEVNEMVRQRTQLERELFMLQMVH